MFCVEIREGELCAHVCVGCAAASEDDDVRRAAR
jgi:hypothetical protein